jgi:phosphate transport system protein
MSIFQKNDPSLVTIALKNAIIMLELGQEMFSLVTDSLVKDTEPEKARNIKQMDKEINKIHREVNRQIFEHLAISPNKNLFPSLVLLTVVKDSERIGDYNKNIAELLEMMPEHLDLEKYSDTFQKLWRETTQMFDEAIRAFKEENEQLAHKVLEEYTHISKICDEIIVQILTEGKSKGIKKDLVFLVLLMRYFKRVNAHLKNIASTVVNPFHRIGYKFKEEE